MDFENVPMTTIRVEMRAGCREAARAKHEQEEIHVVIAKDAGV
jgi:hypothetical protein